MWRAHLTELEAAGSSLHKAPPRGLDGPGTLLHVLVVEVPIPTQEHADHALDLDALDVLLVVLQISQEAATATTTRAATAAAQNRGMRTLLGARPRQSRLPRHFLSPTLAKATSRQQLYGILTNAEASDMYDTSSRLTYGVTCESP